MKTYKTSAGRCDKCGYWKTWGFKVENPRTGNMMPGHIDEDGHKLGNGECPYYTDPDFKKPAFIPASDLPAEPEPEQQHVEHSQSGTWMCTCKNQKCILMIIQGHAPERCIHHGIEDDATWKKV